MSFTHTACASGRREAAPALRLFGAAAPLVGPFVREDSTLGHTLVLAPARDVHARAAYLLAAEARGVPPEDIADALLTRHPRELLGQALGGDVHPRLYRRLDACRLPAWDLDAYRTLDRALQAGVDDVLGSSLTGADDGVPVEEDEVLGLLDLLDDGADPVLRRARLALPVARDREALATVLAALRPLGASGPLEALADGAGARALRRRVGRAVGALRSPHNGLIVGGGWEVVRTVSDLWSIGDDLRLCCGRRSWDAASYALKLASGTGLFLFCATARALAQCSIRLGVVSVTEVRTLKNRRVHIDVERGLADALRAAGLPLVGRDLTDALRALLTDDDSDDEGDDAGAAAEASLDGVEDVGAVNGRGSWQRPR